MSWQNSEKDKILQQVNDALESVGWGSKHDVVKMTVIFTGEFMIEPIEFKVRAKRNLDSITAPPAAYQE